MNKNKLFLLILLSSSNIFSQITLKLIDSISKKPATYVMVLNDQNEIIASSNDLGIVTLNNEVKLTNKIILESIFFEYKEINLEKIQNNSTILLKSKVNILDEVVITANPKKKYLVLTAYYRIYNITDGVLMSFVDAEVKYIKKKNSFQKKVLNFRIFDTIPKIKYKDATPYWVKNLSSKTLFERTRNKYYLRKNDRNEINIIGKKDNKIHGIMKEYTNVMHGSNSIISVVEKELNYTNTYIEEYNSEELLATNIKNLKYQSTTSYVNITPKMIKLSPTLKDKKIKINKKELFIQNVDYVSKEEYKKIMKMGFKDTSISHYNKKFWENLETFTPLEPHIKKQLDELLKERK